MKEPKEIIEMAIADFSPVKFVLMFSGGHDSVVSTHLSASILDSIGLDYVVYHGDTTIGIPQTQDYVRDICNYYGWNLAIRKPPKEEDCYDNIVANGGFPGPTKSSHQYMYRRLKERALRRFVTYECKSAPRKRENVLLLCGVRQSESAIRMGYTSPTRKEGSQIWCNPIFYWKQEDCEAYMSEHQIPRNHVKDKICISGECLCGTFSKKEEWVEIKHNYPEVAKRIESLHEIAKANGFPWHWASGPTEWKKEQLDKMQLKLNFMCVGCESKITVP